MEALQQVVDAHGVNFMATICAICKAQFTKVLPYYGFDMSMVGGVHQLVSTGDPARRRETFRGDTMSTPHSTGPGSSPSAASRTATHKPRPGSREIFDADHSHKCPTYIQSTPPCQGSARPGEDIRGYLNIVRGVEKPPAGMPWQEYAWRRLTEPTRSRR